MKTLKLFAGRASRMVALVMALACVIGLTACHGSQGQAAFEVPETWDSSKTYEITFWAKNDTKRPTCASPTRTTSPRT